MSEQIIFVVHTNSYAGNFERELCAYITGQVGECEVGDDLAEMFAEEVGEDMQEAFAEIIGSNTDDNGCSRPCEIYPTPGRLNNGVGTHFDAAPGQTGYPAYESVAIYFDEMPTDEMFDLMKARTAEYAKTEYNRASYYKDRDELFIKGFELIVEETTVTKKSLAL